MSLATWLYHEARRMRLLGVPPRAIVEQLVRLWRVSR